MSWGSVGAVGWAGHGEEIVFRHPGCWGSDLGWGSWEDWTLMLWRLRGDFRFRKEKVCPAFWPILPPHTTVFLFRCKDNIAHDYSRYCDPSTGRGEYSNTGDLFCGLSDSSEEERV